MTEVCFSRVEDTTLDDIERFINVGGAVIETQHMGQALNGRFHFTAMDTYSTEQAVVDSIASQRDPFGNVGTIAGLTVVSKTKGGRIPAASMQNFEIDDATKGTASVAEVRATVEELGLEPDKYINGKNVDLVDIYMATVKAVAPVGIPVRSYSEIFGCEAGRALMEHGAKNNWFNRFYDADANKVIQIGDRKDQFDIYREFGAYSDNPKTCAGLLPKVEDLFALHQLLGIIEGREQLAHHLGHVAAIYTNEPEFEERVTAATLGTCAELGITGKIRHSLFVAGDELLNGVDGQPDHFTILRRAEIQRRGLRTDEL